MSLIYASLYLRNPKSQNLKSIEVTALIVMGALPLYIPKHIAIQLELQELYQQEMTSTTGQKYCCPYASPIEVVFENKTCFTGALILGEQVLLGSSLIDEMDSVLPVPTKKVVAQSKNISTPVKNIGRRAALGHESKFNVKNLYSMK